MPQTVYTKAERDRLAGAYYGDLHDNDASQPWESLPDWHRFKHRRGVDALLAELERMTDERLTELRRERRRTVRLEQAS